MTKQDWL